MNNITITEVAAAAGVSISSVSRYLKDPKSIKPIAAVKVAQAIKELNYVPSTFAQNLRRGHSNTIGVIVPKLTGYFSEACTAINRFLNLYGYLMIICDTEYDPERERFYIGQLIKQGVAGIIVASSEQDEATILQCLNGFENVLYFVRPMPSQHFSLVNEDIVRGGEAIARSLLSVGYEEYLIVHNNAHFKNHIRKADAIKNVLKAGGIRDHHLIEVADYDRNEEIFDRIAEFLERPGGHKCIIGLSPYITENITIAITIMGLDHQVGIAGYVFKNYTKRFRKNIISCIQDPYEVGLKAAEIMYKQVTSKSTGKQKDKVKEYIINNEVIIDSN